LADKANIKNTKKKPNKCNSMRTKLVSFKYLVASTCSSSTLMFLSTYSLSLSLSLSLSQTHTHTHTNVWMLRLLTLLLSPCEGSRSLQPEVHGLFQCCAGIRNGTQTSSSVIIMFFFVFLCFASYHRHWRNKYKSLIVPILYFGYTLKTKYRDFFSSHLRQLKTF
jgi:hypothetical protein